MDVFWIIAAIVMVFSLTLLGWQYSELQRRNSELQRLQKELRNQRQLNKELDSTIKQNEIAVRELKNIKLTIGKIYSTFRKEFEGAKTDIEKLEAINRQHDKITEYFYKKFVPR